MRQAAEADYRTIRNFQLGFVPGLLQTAEYARCVLALADLPGISNLEEAAAVRMERQQILYEPGRRFEFLMTEAALRWQPGPRDLFRAQLTHIASVATLESVEVGVVPADVEMHAIPRCSFIISEDSAAGQPAIAFVELPHRGLNVAEPADVEIYRLELGRLRESVVYGEGAITLIQEMAVG